MSNISNDPAVLSVANYVLELIKDGAQVGLGSGRASAAFIAKLGERVQGGLKITGVPTSNASDQQARELGIPLVPLTEDLELDLTVDGADEVAPNLDLVKGWGGALVRERIVAAASKRQIILVGRGETGEDARRARAHSRGGDSARAWLCGAQAEGARPAAGHATRIRPTQSKPFITDNGNLTLDCATDEAAARRRGRARARERGARQSPAWSTRVCSSAPASACWWVTPTAGWTSASRSRDGWKIVTRSRRRAVDFTLRARRFRRRRPHLCMATKTRYTTAAAVSPEALDREVSNLLQEGFRLYGNPYAATRGDGPVFCQALTAEEGETMAEQIERAQSAERPTRSCRWKFRRPDWSDDVVARL